MNKLKNQKTLVFEWMKKPEKKIKSNQKFLEKNLLKKCSNLNLKTNKKIYQDLELPAYPANLLICDPRFYVKD